MRNSAKQWISLSLLGLMLIKVWVIPLLYLDYEIRREYIAANFCENKNRPQMHCNGKCYLAKRIASLDEQEKRQAEKNYLSRLIDQAMDQRVDFFFTRQPVTVGLLPRTGFPITSSFTPRIAADDIFHPPLV
ncbi:hypothetical protein [Dyadobacter sp. 676]|uniref:Uncharacterized protein n=1 Tax=Dyadobacter sp. 676 TaxID=3088362 RepID=A0AAU8FTW6_9BACT